MAVTPRDLLAQAERLTREGASEIEWRAASHLAYYAGYHELRRLCPLLKTHLDYQGGVHSQLIGALLDERDSDLKSLGYILRDCKTRRARADYDLKETVTRAEAELQVQTIKRLFAKVAEIVEAQKSSGSKRV